MTRTCGILVVVFLLCISSTVSNAVDIEMVEVGNPGNVSDDYGNGAVSYVYDIGKYEITVSQYAEFLNAVAKQDTYGLYDERMEAGCGITREGNELEYSYVVQSGHSNKPISYVNLADACRFVNWLQNKQPTGTQDETTTESGTYQFNIDGTVIFPNERHGFALPTFDEWYKAAYHYNDGSSEGYYTYPGTDEYYDGMANVGKVHKDTFDVDSYELQSFYGTHCQLGNVAEIIEYLYDNDDFCGTCGKNFNSEADTCGSENTLTITALFSHTSNIGFRVAKLPEPISAGIWGVFAGALLVRRRHRQWTPGRDH